ncbi:MAG TPA: PhzF family phenazine biosynthesis protein [Solirubrobacteraceae bacterium]|jgi:trans-2,3-dihydro-3-hydroxyanthranilate isomerase|nr:PhzF family phenazine biosynthesis protein [Solirubrobacteraceae bacterium]
MSDVLDRLEAFDPFPTRPPQGGGPEERPRRYLLLDVFADRPLEGNQLAVFTDGTGLPAAQMQSIARELKLSESVFLLAPEAKGDARVRIFTPAAELPFAGHPVLGAGVVLAGALDAEQVVLETGSGPVALRIEPGEGRVRSGSMSQPVPVWEQFAAAEELLEALGASASLLPVEVYENGPRHIYVTLGSEREVAALDPDLRTLERIAGAAGVSCFAGGEGSFKTRMFAPGLGVPEDPATGSAAGPLAVHAVRHGLAASGEEIEIRQGAEIGRPSLLRARALMSGERIERVEVGGSAVILARGELWPD